MMRVERKARTPRCFSDEEVVEGLRALGVGTVSALARDLDTNPDAVKKRLVSLLRAGLVLSSTAAGPRGHPRRQGTELFFLPRGDAAPTRIDTLPSGAWGTRIIQRALAEAA